MVAQKQDVYRNLQRHLNKQSVGFPATKSGAEIRILKKLFTPEEAVLATYLDYRPRSTAEISSSAKTLGLSPAQVEQMFEGMVAKGAIGHVEKSGVHYYHNPPLVVGMWEMQVKRLTPEFIHDVEEYFSDRSFGLGMLGTKLPQMRTIPIQKSLRVEHHVTTYDHIKELIENESTFGITECICRKVAATKGKTCQKTSRLETCMILGDSAKDAIRLGSARAITREEAAAIIRQNETEGLVLQPANSQKVEFVCSCCGCCCGMLGLQKSLPKPVDFWATNFFARVDAESCTGCGTCVERCQVNAAAVDEKSGVSTIDLDRCIGCGNCIVTCPKKAITLVKKKRETVPPPDSEGLYQILAENKPGTLDKARLIARLVLKR